MVKQFLMILFYDPNNGWTKEQIEEPVVQKEATKEIDAEEGK